MSQKRSDKIHQCCQCWRRPSNIRTGSDRRHVIDAGSKKEIADTLAITNQLEATYQDPSVLPVMENDQQDPHWPCHVSDAGSKKEIADALVSTNESEAI